MLKIVLSAFGFLAGIFGLLGGVFLAAWAVAEADTRRLAGSEMYAGVEFFACAAVAVLCIAIFGVIVLALGVGAEQFQRWQRQR